MMRARSPMVAPWTQAQRLTSRTASSVMSTVSPRRLVVCLAALDARSHPQCRHLSSTSGSSRPDLDNVPQHKLESATSSKLEAVRLRRERITQAMRDVGESEASEALERIPGGNNEFDAEAFYEQVHGRNCENVVGYVPIPVGVVGPLFVNGRQFSVPLATTEGALLASTNRGARAIREAGGAFCTVTANGMTRSPVLVMPSVKEADELRQWVQDPENFAAMQETFASTTNFGQLTKAFATVAGRYVYIRFTAATGDAMGMNMVGKGVNKIMGQVLGQFPQAELISLSSNMCTDKKPSALNWTQGRGKSVIAEVVLPRKVVEKVLKTTIPNLARLNVAKNLVGSALAGSIGGNNAHASNLVTAFFLAHGQDPAQNVESSNCMLMLEASDDGESLHASVTMPSLEVGTVGGGTSLPAQRACLELHGLAGSNREDPGSNASRLAEIACATVLAGELSLNAALASNHLISAHMDLNRKA